MGCSASKLDDQEAVQLCKDRRNFIKQAVEQRYRFALGQIAYIESIRRVSIALHNFVRGNEHQDVFMDHHTAQPFTPAAKRLSPDIIMSARVVKFLRPSGNPSIPIEEWPQSPETVQVESFHSSSHYGIDGFFTYEASQTNRPFSSSPYNNRPSYPPTSPQNPQWDFFFNPFSWLNRYSYQYNSNNDENDEMARLRKVRVEEGIPELEEIRNVEEEENDVDDDDDDEQENKDNEKFMKPQAEDEKAKPITKPTPVMVSNDKSRIESERERDKNANRVQESKKCQSEGAECIQVSQAQTTVEVEASSRNSGAEETPGFTVYVNRRPTSMVEVIKDVESQFERIFDSATEVSVMLEASRAQYPASNELAGVKILNPAVLFRSPSSRSSSSRCLISSTINISSRDEGDETGSNYSEECCMVSGSHQSTLDRLYAWEKKLYDEVKRGEQIRIAYEKKCMQLRRHDVNGEEPSVVDKTRAAIRDLHTRLNVSMHSVESVSRRIETLRDEELFPQLMELIQGLSRMWRTMSECHMLQKRTIDEAKLLLFSSSSANLNIPNFPDSTSPLKPSKHALDLVLELKSWRSSLSAWMNAQRFYARALSGWISRCARPQTANSDDPAATRAPPVYRLCFHWSRLLDSMSEGPVMEGIDFFAAGIGSVTSSINPPQIQMEGGAAVTSAPSQRTGEVGERVLCAGMGATVGALTEFAGGMSQGYRALLNKFEGGVMAGRAEQ